MVIDSTDRDRLPLCKTELHRMLGHDQLKSAALLVLANKQDLKNALSAQEISEKLGLSDLKTRPWHIQACCALTGEG
jgi:ADP-ribosylation factor-like protein 5B